MNEIANRISESLLSEALKKVSSDILAKVLLHQRRYEVYLILS